MSQKTKCNTAYHIIPNKHPNHYENCENGMYLQFYGFCIKSFSVISF